MLTLERLESKGLDDPQWKGIMSVDTPSPYHAQLCAKRFLAEAEGNKVVFTMTGDRINDIQAELDERAHYADNWLKENAAILDELSFLNMQCTAIDHLRSIVAELSHTS